MSPACQFCGAEMRIIRRGSGKGGRGAKYECPNKPHRRCPECNHVLDTRPDYFTKVRSPVCHYCGWKETRRQ